MGGLVSKPKAPAAPVVVQSNVVAPVQQAVTQETPSPETGTDPAEQRKANLLARDRGRFGTVLTSFRGFLGQNNAATIQRKTLLGE